MGDRKTKSKLKSEVSEEVSELEQDTKPKPKPKKVLRKTSAKILRNKTEKEADKSTEGKIEKKSRKLIESAQGLDFFAEKNSLLESDILGEESALALDDSQEDILEEVVEDPTRIIAQTRFPVLSLKDVVVYPNMAIPLFVGRERSVKALEAAMPEAQQVLLVAQKDPQNDSPLVGDLFETGTVGRILQLLRLPDGTFKVLVEGLEKAKIEQYYWGEDYTEADVSLWPEDSYISGDKDSLARGLISQFEQYVKLNKRLPIEVLQGLSGLDSLERVADTISAHLILKIKDRQRILETKSLSERIKLLIDLMDTETKFLQLDKKIRTRVKGQIERNQHEYYLNEQMKAIQEELGQGKEGLDILASFEQRLAKTKMTKEAKQKAEAELRKLKAMSPMSAEATVSRTYIEHLLDTPWKKSTRLKHDLSLAKKILDEDHYGLKEVKDRILEYLAVCQRVNIAKGPILCLVGPPGVGKTSLGQSIARATGRIFARMALGGVRDEAEIRGHRRTYVGALPGRVIQKMIKAKTNNPLFLLDEIDKMSADFRGDPAAALLEVLDPEQNVTFADHYLEVDFDLSKVMFVATANTLSIPDALRDRMEIIHLSSYTEDEKFNIAKTHLIPKNRKAVNLKASEMEIPDSVITKLIRHYTREAGVRSLEKEIAKLCRKAIKELQLNPSLKTIVLTEAKQEEYLGVPKYRYGVADQEDQIGQVTGLAWTEVGGELLKIETVAVPGTGKTQFTGQLGDVMKESIQAAVSVVRARSDRFGIPTEFYKDQDLHIHVPEGATPKDGPSAGIAMCTALVSVLTHNPVKADVAMTGEITLRGEVLPIGGLKEKLLAAHRGGVMTVIIPEENKKDLVDIDPSVLNKLNIHPCKIIDEVLQIALSRPFVCANDAPVTSKKVGARLSPPSNRRKALSTEES